MSNEVYALVDHDRVIEYPVTVGMIQQRNHSTGFYTQVVNHEEPVHYPEIQILVQYLTVENGKVHRRYTVEPKPLEQMLQSFRRSDNTIMNYSDASATVINAVKAAIIDYAEKKIEDFAKEKGYDSINNAIGRYRFSTVEKYKQEAERIQAELDNMWLALTTYFDELRLNLKSLPANMSAIDSIVPTPHW